MAKQRAFGIIGLGTFGVQTAMELFRAGAEVLAIDQDMAVVEEAKDFVTRAYCGDATDEEVLRSVGFFDVDVVVVAIRKRFDTTVLVTHMLKLEGVTEIHVQVDSAREASAIRALGARQAIFPESDLAKRFAMQLLHPKLTDFFALGEGIGLIEVVVPEAWVGKNLISLEMRKKHRVSVVALRRTQIRRGIEIKEAMEPSPEEPLVTGDELIVLGNAERLSRFRQVVEEELDRTRMSRDQPKGI